MNIVLKNRWSIAIMAGLLTVPAYAGDLIIKNTEGHVYYSESLTQQNDIVITGCSGDLNALVASAINAGAETSAVIDALIDECGEEAEKIVVNIPIKEVIRQRLAAAKQIGQGSDKSYGQALTGSDNPGILPTKKPTPPSPN